jgi:dienelactone hydrolase
MPVFAYDFLERVKTLFVYSVFCSFIFFLSTAHAIDEGTGELTVNAAGYEILLYTYRPSCNDPSILFVFHGLNRKAKSVRNKAKKIADEACLMVFSPLFDKARFPNWRYHRAGIIRNKKIQPPSKWTIPILRALLDYSRQQVNHPNPSVYLFGHSAGGQFLSRIIAYTTLPNIERIVIANPSVYVLPNLMIDAPYGFRGIFKGTEARDRLTSYLKAPITIYIGRDDIGNKNLVEGATASRQGKNRYERAINIYREGQRAAHKLGISMEWRLIEVTGVGHSSAGMLKSSKLLKALGIGSIK